jgi:glutathione reductase (NADPH)
MVDLLTQASAPLGIDVHCDVAITGVKKVDRTFMVETEDGQRYASDLVVHGAGRVADIQNLDLDRAGIAYSQRGITVDTQMATTNPSVYAVGDCAASIQLARVADAEAYVAAANILSAIKGEAARQTMNYSAVPAVLFTYPQYGMVGATEDALQEKGIAYSKSFGEALSWPTYKRIGMPSAAFKLLADDAGKLLGAHILSDNAAGAINSLALAMTNGIAVSDLYRQSILTPYPSRESDMLYMLKPLIK